MNLFNIYRAKIVAVIEELQKNGKLPGNLNLENVAVESPKEESHGDISTNAAMVLSKSASMNPRAIAEVIIEGLKRDKSVVSVEIAGPGFINIKLVNDVWYELLKEILLSGKDYGNSDIGKGKKINVEYVSANPTGPLHIGHARGAVYGDALALLLMRAGFDVTKEYYVNDAGSQIDTLTKSAFLRYREALGENIGSIPAGLYPGEYLKNVGDSLVSQYGRELLNMKEEESFLIVRNFAVESMLELIKMDLMDLGIIHDVFVSERSIMQKGLIEEGVKLLESKGLVYKGVLEAPKGKKLDDWESREQTLFKSTLFGDDSDRALMKSDGSYTYFASDIAYHLDKIKRGFNDMVIVLGADHGGYIKRLKAIVGALSDNKASIDVKISQLVKFMENGQPAKMSKRSGTFTTVRDVLDEIGKDVIRFIMLTRKNDAVLDFDLALAKEQSKDNPIFYVQYAYARAKSVLRTAALEMKDSYEAAMNIDSDLLHLLSDPDELSLIKKLALWPKIVESAAIANEPHRVAFYLQDVAASFHALWNKGNENATLRFIIKEDKNVSSARLMLINAVSLVIASGLMIFAIEPKEEMR